MVRAGFRIRLDQHRAGPQFLRADPRKIHSRRPQHPRRLRRVAIQSIASDDPHTLGAPIDVRLQLFLPRGYKWPRGLAPPHENTPNLMNPNNENSAAVQFRLPPAWTVAAPVFAGVVLLAAGFGLGRGMGGFLVAIIALGLGGAVFAAVHHADVVAHRAGQPYGTLVLALAVTLIEVALIVSLMIAGGEEAAGLARDTVFAAVMIILNGIIGLCLLVGGLMHREQSFSLDGVSAALVALGAIVILTLVFPNYTVTTPGPYYSSSQLGLIGVVTLVIYGTFVFTQTIGHRQFFLQDDDTDKSAQHPAPPSNAMTAVSSMLLLFCLVA